MSQIGFLLGRACILSLFIPGKYVTDSLRYILFLKYSLVFDNIFVYLRLLFLKPTESNLVELLQYFYFLFLQPDI